jgi:hypothetical protein
MVYLLLGTPGSGRRQLLLDLIKNGTGLEDSIHVLLPPDEPPQAAEEVLSALPNVSLSRSEALPTQLNEPIPQTCFYVASGHSNPVDVVEKWKEFLLQNQGRFELARILTVVHCQFLIENPSARPWYDACIHFSDVVLLNHREAAGNKWVADFQKEFEKKHYPCLFEWVKKGGVSNPARVLQPESRRLSLAFDFWEDHPAIPPDLEVEIEGDDPDEDEEDAIPEDPYFARMPGGRRRKKIPDIRGFL